MPQCLHILLEAVLLLVWLVTMILCITRGLGLSVTETSQQTEQALYSGGLFHSHGQIWVWILCILNPCHFPLIIFISSSSILGACINWRKCQQCMLSILNQFSRQRLGVVVNSTSPHKNNSLIFFVSSSQHPDSRACLYIIVKEGLWCSQTISQYL